MKTLCIKTAQLLALHYYAMAAASSPNDQCFDFTPMTSVSTYLGAELDYSVADRICCHNHKWAEYRGYLAAPEVDFFGRLDASVETVFYDSVCGIPLFIAPRGRSFDDFRQESLKHGWPSFRPEELVSENVIIHNDGRMESVCKTHLGHNLPEGGVDRYCIDLVCMAGEPLSEDDERNEILLYLQGTTAINATDLNTTSYTSSAEQFSGKTSNTQAIIISVVVVAVVIGLGTLFAYFHLRDNRSAAERKAGVVVPENSSETRDSSDD